MSGYRSSRSAPRQIDYRGEESSSSSPHNRSSTSTGISSTQSEGTTFYEDALLDDSPCPLPSKARRSFWTMHNINFDSSKYEEAASLLSDPSEKIAEIELRDAASSSSQQQASPSHNASTSITQIYRSPRTFIRQFFRTLVPSFMSSRSSPGELPSKPERIHPTAYLDGMRGLAAFAVVLCHLSYTVFVITVGYGQVDGPLKEGEKSPVDDELLPPAQRYISGPGDNNRFIQLPFIRLFYSGPPMVALFFIISGYALSNKPIKQMRARQYEGLMSTLSSSVFRRGFRLFLPCFASTMLVFWMVRIGLYELTRELYNNKELFRNIDEAHCPRGDNILDQFVHWSRQMWDFVHPWDWWIFGGSTVYDRHLWTIPVEFRASLVLFLSLVGVAKFKARLRIASFLALALWALRWDRWEMLLFWFGAFFAELDQVKAAHASHNPDLPTTNGHAITSTSKGGRTSSLRFPKLWSVFWLANFIMGLYLCSYPDQKASTTPGFVLLTKMIPKWYSDKIRFWQSIGAIQIVWACTNAEFLQRLFTGRIVQYLGKISYSIYLMHGPVIHTFGFAAMGFFWGVLGAETRTKWEVGFFIAAVLTLMVIVWAADVFWRVVDIPSVKFARWLETKVVHAAGGR